MVVIARCNGCGAEMPNVRESDIYDLYCPKCGKEAIQRELDRVYKIEVTA